MIRGLTYYWDDGANLGKGVIEFATLRPQPFKVRHVEQIGEYMAKLQEVLTQLSDLDPEKEYNLTVTDNNISINNGGEDSGSSGDDNSVDEENKQLKAQIEELKKTNQSLLLRTPLEKEKSAEEIIYSLCVGKEKENA